MPDTIQIREFAAGDETAFRRLNEEWIRRWFAMEPKDEEVFADPQRQILDKGGRILMASEGGETVGCCALLAMGHREFEVAKMAVAPERRRGGIGRLVLGAAIELVRAHGGRRLYLETNHTLTGAICLYKALGFAPVPPERLIPSPYSRADVFLELWLGPHQAKIMDRF